MLEIQVDQELNRLSINFLRGNDSFVLLKHGDEGAGHWYELFEALHSNLRCGNGCDNNIGWLAINLTTALFFSNILVSSMNLISHKLYRCLPFWKII